MTHTRLLEARRVHFGYSPDVPVICGASLTIPHGALCALIGSNGSGKSTLIRLFSGVLHPTGGQIYFEGVPFRAVPRREAAKQIAYVPQATTMAFPFTALEVVLTGRSPYAPRFRFESELDRAKAREALATVNAIHLASRPVTELSGGERQIVAVARALAQEPACLLLDETSSSLDLKHRAGLVRTLARLRDTYGLTTVVVTHDLHLVDPVFDQVFALRCGEVIAEGRPGEVLTDKVLAAVYDDPCIRTRRVDGRPLIWSN
jgi:iron complex transport system ATP-binding protein